MVAAVFRTKFTVPSLPVDYRRRPRLDDLWKSWRDRRLITVVAGAGWGKTCFLAAYARKRGRKVLWYTLDELDRDPELLAAHLTAACDLPATEAPAVEQLAGIVGALEKRSLVVLDDVHAVKEAPAAREFLARLLRYLPQTCQLVIASRGPVSLAGAGLDVRGRAVRVHADDLAYAVAETTDMLERRLGRAAGRAAAARVQTMTEGWPTGVAIIAQALAETDPGEHSAALERLGAGGTHWFDFFADEVLAGLEPRVQRFLERAAVLPHLEARLCDAVLRTRGSARILDDLAHRGIFTVPVGEGAWRFHHLFRGSLLRRMEAALPSRRVRELRRRAARALADDGEPEAGLLELARAGDLRGAQDHCRRHLDALLLLQRPEALGVALAAMDEAGQKTVPPPVRLVRAALAQLTGRWDEAEGDLQAVMRAGRTRRVAGAARARLVVQQMRRGRFASCLRRGKSALAADQPLAPADRGAVLAAMGVVAASLGRLDQGEGFLREALASARRRRDRAEEGRCRYLLAANVHFIRGDLDAALSEAEAACAVFRELGRPDLACHADGVHGFVLAGGGRRAEARQVSQQALQRAEAIGYPLVAGYARLSLGECELQDGHLPAAARRFVEALGLARTLGEEVLATWAHLGLAETAWRDGDLHAADREAGAALELARSRGDRFCEARALGLLGLARREDDPPAADKKRRRAASILRKLGAAGEERRQQDLWAISPDAERPLPETPSPEGGAGGLRLLVLGPLLVARDGAVVIEGGWRSRRARRLLNVLLAHRLRPVPREVVMEALWPGADPRKAAVNLRQTVFQLRGIIEPEGADEPRHVLTTGAETVRLALGPGGGWDLGEFQAGLAEAAAARRSGDAATELSALEGALELWRGPLLADTPYDPAVEELGAAVRHRYLRALERALDLLAGHGRFDAVVDLARRGLETDPLQEEFARHLLKGLLASGHRVDVRREYAAFASRMVKELDLLPSVRLKELAERAAD